MNSPEYRDGYRRLGDSANYMDPAIDLAQANSLRQLVVDKMFALSNTIVQKLDVTTTKDDETYMGYSAFFRAGTLPLPTSDTIFDKKIFVGACIKQFTDNGWQLSVVRNRYGRVDDGLSEQRLSTRYRVVCLGDSVMEAYRTVKLIKVMPAILAGSVTISDESLAGEANYKRVGFTTPLLPEDCEVMAEFIGRHATRVKLERGL